MFYKYMRVSYKLKLSCDIGNQDFYWRRSTTYCICMGKFEKLVVLTTCVQSGSSSWQVPPPLLASTSAMCWVSSSGKPTKQTRAPANTFSLCSFCNYYIFALKYRPKMVCAMKPKCIWNWLIRWCTHDDVIISGEAGGVVAPLPAGVDPGPRQHGQAEAGRISVLVTRRRGRDQVRHFTRHVLADRPAHVVDQGYQVRLPNNTSIVHNLPIIYLHVFHRFVIVMS